MTVSQLLKFGSYTFPSGFYVSSTPGNSALQIDAAPYRDGALVGGSRLSEKIIEIRGTLFGDATTLRSKLDSLNAAVNAGKQKLYLWNDRFIYATKSAYVTSYDPTSFDRYCDVSISFVCDTALWEADIESTNTWASPVNGNTRTITTAGNAQVFPKFAIKFAATAANMGIAIGSASFTLVGTVTAGDVVEVDCATKTVVLQSSGADKMAMFDGVFPVLAVGANTVTLSISGGSSAITQIVTTWRDRWF